MKKYSLMIPGPCEVTGDVLAEMSRPMVAHYGPDWLEVFEDVRSSLKQVLGTSGDVFITVGSGFAGVEAGLTSLIEKGDRVLIVEGGLFGQRMVQIAQACGAEPVVIKTGWGKPVSVSEIKAALDSNPGIRAVGVVHSDTSCGILNPVREIGQLMRAYPDIPLVVDAVSSAGIMDFRMDDWNVDIVSTASQKGLEAPPGLAVVAVSSKAWQAIDRRQGPGNSWYLDLKVWREFAERNKEVQPYAITMAVNNVRALRASLQRMLVEGLESRYQRHERIADFVRCSVRDMGLELAADGDYASNCLTVVRCPGTFTSDDVVEYFKCEFGIQVAKGLGEHARDTFRIGHMGSGASIAAVLPIVVGLERFLIQHGHSLEAGTCLRALERAMQGGGNGAASK